MRTDALNLLEQLTDNKVQELQIITRNGEVHINSKTFDFTYIGTFGHICSSMILKNHCINDLSKKLIILSANCQAYSERIGGINIVQITN